MDDVYHIRNKKLEHQFLSEVDMKKKDPNLASILVHSK